MRSLRSVGRFRLGVAPLGQDRQHAIRSAFISWAARQSPRPGLVFPEVSTAGKKIDLVCVEEPLDPGKIAARTKMYILDSWLRANTHLSRQSWVRRLGIDLPYMRTIAKQLRGNRVWLVEIKEYLNAQALGQVLIYAYHFAQDYPEMTLGRFLVGCVRTDPVVEEVSTMLGIETIVLQPDAQLRRWHASVSSLALA